MIVPEVFAHFHIVNSNFPDICSLKSGQCAIYSFSIYLLSNKTELGRRYAAIYDFDGIQGSLEEGMSASSLIKVLKSLEDLVDLSQIVSLIDFLCWCVSEIWWTVAYK